MQCVHGSVVLSVGRWSGLSGLVRFATPRGPSCSTGLVFGRGSEPDSGSGRLRTTGSHRARERFSLGPSPTMFQLAGLHLQLRCFSQDLRTPGVALGPSSLSRVPTSTELRRSSLTRVPTSTELNQSRTPLDHLRPVTS